MSIKRKIITIITFILIFIVILCVLMKSRNEDKILIKKQLNELEIKINEMKSNIIKAKNSNNHEMEVFFENQLEMYEFRKKSYTKN